MANKKELMRRFYEAKKKADEAKQIPETLDIHNDFSQATEPDLQQPPTQPDVGGYSIPQDTPQVNPNITQDLQDNALPESPYQSAKDTIGDVAGQAASGVDAAYKAIASIPAVVQAKTNQLIALHNGASPEAAAQMANKIMQEDTSGIDTLSKKLGYDIPQDTATAKAVNTGMAALAAPIMALHYGVDQLVPYNKYPKTNVALGLVADAIGMYGMHKVLGMPEDKPVPEVDKALGTAIDSLKEQKSQYPDEYLPKDHPLKYVEDMVDNNVPTDDIINHVKSVEDFHQKTGTESPMYDETGTPNGNFYGNEYEGNAQPHIDNPALVANTIPPPYQPTPNDNLSGGGGQNPTTAKNETMVDKVNKYLVHKPNGEVQPFDLGEHKQVPYGVEMPFNQNLEHGNTVTYRRNQVPGAKVNQGMVVHNPQTASTYLVDNKAPDEVKYTYAAGNANDIAKMKESLGYKLKNANQGGYVSSLQGSKNGKAKYRLFIRPPTTESWTSTTGWDELNKWTIQKTGNNTYELRLGEPSNLPEIQASVDEYKINKPDELKRVAATYTFKQVSPTVYVGEPAGINKQIPKVSPEQIYSKQSFLKPFKNFGIYLADTDANTVGDSKANLTPIELPYNKESTYISDDVMQFPIDEAEVLRTGDPVIFLDKDDKSIIGGAVAVNKNLGKVFIIGGDAAGDVPANIIDSYANAVYVPDKLGTSSKEIDTTDNAIEDELTKRLDSLEQSVNNHTDSINKTGQYKKPTEELPEAPEDSILDKTKPTKKGIAKKVKAVIKKTTKTINDVDHIIGSTLNNEPIINPYKDSLLDTGATVNANELKRVDNIIPGLQTLIDNTSGSIKTDLNKLLDGLAYIPMHKNMHKLYTQLIDTIVNSTDEVKAINILDRLNQEVDYLKSKKGVAPDEELKKTIGKKTLLGKLEDATGNKYVIRKDPLQSIDASYDERLAMQKARELTKQHDTATSGYTVGELLKPTNIKYSAQIHIVPMNPFNLEKSIPLKIASIAVPATIDILGAELGGLAGSTIASQLSSEKTLTHSAIKSIVSTSIETAAHELGVNIADYITGEAYRDPIFSPEFGKMILKKIPAKLAGKSVNAIGNRIAGKVFGEYSALKQLKKNKKINWSNMESRVIANKLTNKITQIASQKVVNYINKELGVKGKNPKYEGDYKSYVIHQKSNENANNFFFETNNPDFLYGQTLLLQDPGTHNAIGAGHVVAVISGADKYLVEVKPIGDTNAQYFIQQKSITKTLISMNTSNLVFRKQGDTRVIYPDTNYVAPVVITNLLGEQVINADVLLDKTEGSPVYNVGTIRLFDIDDPDTDYMIKSGKGSIYLDTITPDGDLYSQGFDLILDKDGIGKLTPNDADRVVRKGESKNYNATLTDYYGGRYLGNFKLEVTGDNKVKINSDSFFFPKNSIVTDGTQFYKIIKTKKGIDAEAEVVSQDMADNPRKALTNKEKSDLMVQAIPKSISVFTVNKGKVKGTVLTNVSTQPVSGGLFLYTNTKLAKGLYTLIKEHNKPVQVYEVDTQIDNGRYFLKPVKSKLELFGPIDLSDFYEDTDVATALHKSMLDAVNRLDAEEAVKQSKKEIKALKKELKDAVSKKEKEAIEKELNAKIRKLDSEIQKQYKTNNVLDDRVVQAEEEIRALKKELKITTNKKKRKQIENDIAGLNRIIDNVFYAKPQGKELIEELDNLETDDEITNSLSEKYNDFMSKVNVVQKNINEILKLKQDALAKLHEEKNRLQKLPGNDNKLKLINKEINRLEKELSTFNKSAVMLKQLGYEPVENNMDLYYNDRIVFEYKGDFNQALVKKFDPKTGETLIMLQLSPRESVPMTINTRKQVVYKQVLSLEGLSAINSIRSLSPEYASDTAFDADFQEDKNIIDKLLKNTWFGIDFFNMPSNIAKSGRYPYFTSIFDTFKMASREAHVNYINKKVEFQKLYGKDIEKIDKEVGEALLSGDTSKLSKSAKAVYDKWVEFNKEIDDEIYNTVAAKYNNEIAKAQKLNDDNRVSKLTTERNEALDNLQTGFVRFPHKALDKVELELVIKSPIERGGVKYRKGAVISKKIVENNPEIIANEKELMGKEATKLLFSEVNEDTKERLINITQFKSTGADTLKEAIKLKSSAKSKTTSSTLLIKAYLKQLDQYNQHVSPENIADTPLNESIFSYIERFYKAKADYEAGKHLLNVPEPVSQRDKTITKQYTDAYFRDRDGVDRALQTLRGVLYFKYITLKVMSPLRNLTQPIVLTIPRLLERGYIPSFEGFNEKAILTMVRYLDDPNKFIEYVKSAKSITKAKKAKLITLYKRGAFNTHYEDYFIKSGTKGGFLKFIDYMNEHWTAFGDSDSVNRIRTAMLSPNSMSIDDTEKLIKDTQFDYSKENTPIVALKSPLVKTLMLFQSYPMSMLGLLKSMAGEDWKFDDIPESSKTIIKKSSALSALILAFVSIAGLNAFFGADKKHKMNQAKKGINPYIKRGYDSSMLNQIMYTFGDGGIPAVVAGIDLSGMVNIGMPFVGNSVDNDMNRQIVKTVGGVAVKTALDLVKMLKDPQLVDLAGFNNQFKRLVIGGVVAADLQLGNLNEEELAKEMHIPDKLLFTQDELDKMKAAYNSKLSTRDKVSKKIIAYKMALAASKKAYTNFIEATMHRVAGVPSYKRSLYWNKKKVNQAVNKYYKTKVSNALSDFILHRGIKSINALNKELKDKYQNKQISLATYNKYYITPEKAYRVVYKQLSDIRKNGILKAIKGIRSGKNIDKLFDETKNRLSPTIKYLVSNYPKFEPQWGTKQPDSKVLQAKLEKKYALTHKIIAHTALAGYAKKLSNDRRQVKTLLEGKATVSGLSKLNAIINQHNKTVKNDKVYKYYAKSKHKDAKDYVTGIPIDKNKLVNSVISDVKAKHQKKWVSLRSKILHSLDNVSALKKILANIHHGKAHPYFLQEYKALSRVYREAKASGLYHYKLVVDKNGNYTKPIKLPVIDDIAMDFFNDTYNNFVKLGAKYSRSFDLENLGDVIKEFIPNKDNYEDIIDNKVENFDDAVDREREKLNNINENYK